jgi:hypothetical protein
MRLWMTTFAVALTPALLQGQTTTHPTHIPVPRSEQDIRQVQRDYLAIPYGLQLSLLAEAATSGTLDGAEFRDAMTQARSLTISLTDIKAGMVKDIADRPWTDFATIPDPGAEVLYVDAEWTNDVKRYGVVKVHWGDQEKHEEQAGARSWTVAEMLEPLNALHNTTFTRYVTYTVSATYKERSVKYRAIYFRCEEDDRKHQIVDLHMLGPRYSDTPGAYGPSAILYSKLRDVPQVHEWVTAHLTTDENCQEQNSLCCVTGKCLYRQVDYDRKFLRPIPDAENEIQVPFAPGVTTGISLATAATGCNPDLPSQCACVPLSCIPLSMPYSTYPPAQCLVRVLNRQVFLGGLVPTGAYHNWITTVVHAAGMTNQDEILDGGPYGNCALGYCVLATGASPPPTGWQTGDTMQGAGWYSTGMSSAVCEAVIDIQSFTANFSNGIQYIISGPNSNSYAFSATAEWTSELGYLPGTEPVGNPSRWSPGWGTVVQ